MSDRDCENCKHHTEKGCDSWDCEFEQKMTREEAIEFIGQSVKNDVDMAKVADAIIAIEQKPCEDAVNRKAINNLRKYNLVGGIVTVSLKDINKLPPANPQEPKTGRWIESDTVLIVGYTDTDNYINLPAQECSICHKPHIRGYGAYYCPNCGAKMAESEDKE